ncbi:MAG TPA: hypothetical protein PLK90_10595 [Clostridiales bacterium]|nr:hypothetical protein [Clostridiales bacterium]HQP70837.1 hypothetical protein [Clostridiales bacterium]
MFKNITVIFISVILFSCASTSDKGKPLGTGKPKFASLELEEISYHLSSEDGSYSFGKPLKLYLKMKNNSQSRKTFTFSKNKFFILTVSSELSRMLKSTDIPSSGYMQGNSFELYPEEEKAFEITTDTSDEFFAKENTLFCQIRLFFLPKQFRRNALSIYIEKK